MNQTFAKPVQKIDILLTRVLDVPADLSAQLCQKLNEAPAESQQVALEMIGNEARRLLQAKKAVLQKIRSIKTRMKSEFEKVSKSQAETDLEEALKNI